MKIFFIFSVALAINHMECAKLQALPDNNHNAGGYKPSIAAPKPSISTVPENFVSNSNEESNNGILTFMGNLPTVLIKKFQMFLLKFLEENESTSLIPATFDARLEWPHCRSIREIRDQGSCGSCWAIAAVEVMSDRICIHSKGKQTFRFSAIDLLTCCDNCGSCDGGYQENVWKHWVSHGIVSGGSYGSSEGCRSYEVSPCEHHITGSRPPCKSYNETETPACVKKCQSGYNISYNDDLHYGAKIYSILSGDSERIQREIMTNGPVQASFVVYEDLLHYKTGVYKHVEGSEFVELHSIKILGWGTEDGSPYWLIANSWNTDWGDNGFFKILRGENHCEIEESIMAGIPKL